MESFCYFGVEIIFKPEKVLKLLEPFLSGIHTKIRSLYILGMQLVPWEAPKATFGQILYLHEVYSSMENCLLQVKTLAFLYSVHTVLPHFNKQHSITAQQ